MDGEVYFTQGTHPSDGSSTGIKSGIDLAPKRVVNCALGTKALVEEQAALATASGILTIVGNEKDANDPNHSIVEIQESGTGLRFGLMHLSQLPDHVQVGGRVLAGAPIGKSSCEVPKGGKTTGVHLHQYVKDKTGKYLPINGFTFSGWRVAGDTMTKGNEKRVADQRRCATDQACGGIRNDLGTFWRSSKSGLVDSVKVDPLPTVTPTRIVPKSPPRQAESIPTTPSAAARLFIQALVSGDSNKALQLMPVPGQATYKAVMLGISDALRACSGSVTEASHGLRSYYNISFTPSCGTFGSYYDALPSHDVGNVKAAFALLGQIDPLRNRRLVGCTVTVMSVNDQWRIMYLPTCLPSQ
ncbi:hypothetical protein HYS96_00815 [Candidatus Daviesbacteria bacterium]|nr:hypothetical protein [Candidatus Daviesbacteria bacterium]